MANTQGKTVKVRLVKGLRGTQARHRLSVKALGLNKLNDVLSKMEGLQGINDLIVLLSILERAEDAQAKKLAVLHSQRVRELLEGGN